MQLKILSLKCMSKIFLSPQYVDPPGAATGVFWKNCCKTSSISRTKSQNLTVSHVVLQLSLSNPLKPGVK